MRVLEDDDVAVRGVVEDLLDEHAVAGHERRLHRTRRDVERLNDERLEQEGEREHDEHRELAEERKGATALRLLLLVRGRAFRLLVAAALAPSADPTLGRRGSRR